MSALEFAEWMAYFGLEPWGYEMENWRFGMLAATAANLQRDPRRQRPYKPEDFMPKSPGTTSRPRTWEDLKAIARLWNRVLGGQEE